MARNNRHAEGVMNGSSDHESFFTHSSMKHDPTNNRMDVHIEHPNVNGGNPPTNKSKGFPIPSLEDGKKVSITKRVKIDVSLSQPYYHRLRLFLSSHKNFNNSSHLMLLS